MARGKKTVERVVELMKDPKHIRNIGIVAHIDHGKTTLSDNLLAGAGIISEELAGKQTLHGFGCRRAGPGDYHRCVKRLDGPRVRGQGLPDQHDRYAGPRGLRWRRDACDACGRRRSRARRCGRRHDAPDRDRAPAGVEGAGPPGPLHQQGGPAGQRAQGRRDRDADPARESHRQGQQAHQGHERGVLQ